MSPKKTHRIVMGMLCLSILFALAGCGKDEVTEPPTTYRLKLILPHVQSDDCSAAAFPVIVEHFAGVAGLEIHIRYEPEYAKYDSISSPVVSGAVVNATDETIHLVWADIDNVLSLPDRDTLALIYLSNLDASCQMTFEQNTEVVDVGGNPIDASLEDGSIECANGD